MSGTGVDGARRDAADSLAGFAGPTPLAVVGFDGFLDTIARAVDRRHSASPDDYEAMRTIGTLGGRISGAAGRSTNIELRADEVRAGGNGPLMAGALARLGVGVTLIGALGSEAEPRGVAREYRSVTDLCERAVSIAASARTDALEFDDGKIMFNWSANLDGVDFGRLVEVLGEAGLAETIGGADLLATINWTNLGGLGSIWRGLRERVLPGLASPPAMFVDLSDPAKRSDDDLVGATEELRALDAVTPVTLGLNIAEAERIAGLLSGVDATGTIVRTPEGMADAASRLRGLVGVREVVTHTRGAVAAAREDGRASVATRIVGRPVISTGAGDHFNGGYAAARAMGLGLAASLACGCDTASEFVRTGRAPDRVRLIEVLGEPLTV